MRPTCQTILNSIGMDLASRYLPKASSDSEKADLILKAFLLGVVAEEFENAAHRRIEENTALRQLFSESIPVIQDPGLKSRLASTSETKDSDTHISALDRTNNHLLNILIELHAYLDEQEDEESRRLLEKIWEALKDYSRRREFKLWETSQAMLLEARKGGG
jgi:hypothetical protein